MKTRRIIGVAILFMFLALSCKGDPMQAGRAALAMENADQAEAAFKEALSQDPKNQEAQRMMAEVLKLRSDFEGAEKALDAIWDEKGFVNGAAPRPPEDKLLRKLMKEQYGELHILWLQKLDAKQDEAVYQGVIERGILKNPDSAKINRFAVEFYMHRAERLLETKDRVGAMSAYNDVLMFKATPEQRTEAEDRSINLRKELFTEATMREFEAKVKPTLIETNRWDESRKAIRGTVTNEFDQRIDVTNDVEMAAARQTTMVAVQTLLADLVSEGTGAPINADIVKKFGTPKHVLEGETVKGKKMMVTVLLPIDEAIDYAFRFAEAVYKANQQEVHKPPQIGAVPVTTKLAKDPAKKPEPPSKPPEGGSPAN